MVRAVAQVDRTVRGSRAIVVLAVILIFAGSCGIGNAVTGLTTDAVVPAAPVPTGASPELDEASAAVQRELARAALEAPYRRPLGAANLVVSAMLIVGGIMLFTRRPSAPWWITQAAVANILWRVGHSSSYLYQLERNADALRGAFARQRQAIEVTPDAQAWMLFTDALVPTMIMHAALSAIPVALWVWVIWRVRRDDVRAVLGAPRAPR